MNILTKMYVVSRSVLRDEPQAHAVQEADRARVVGSVTSPVSAVV